MDLNLAGASSKSMTRPRTGLLNRAHRPSKLRNGPSPAERTFRWLHVGPPPPPATAVEKSSHELTERQPADGEGGSARLVAKGAMNGVHFHTG